jgi:hypothetical protein
MHHLRDDFFFNKRFFLYGDYRSIQVFYLDLPRTVLDVCTQHSGLDIK